MRIWRPPLVFPAPLSNLHKFRFSIETFYWFDWFVGGRQTLVATINDHVAKFHKPGLQPIQDTRFSVTTAKSAMVLQSVALIRKNESGPCLLRSILLETPIDDLPAPSAPWDHSLLWLANSLLH